MAHRKKIGIRGASPSRKKKHKKARNPKLLQKEFEKFVAQSCGMGLQWNNDGFSLEKLYEAAGREDRIVTISLRLSSLSGDIWGDSITCRLIYTERDRLHLQENINNGVSTYGKVRAKYLLNEFSSEQIEKLESEGFDSQDVTEILVAPQLAPSNMYGVKEKRKINTIEIPLDSEPPIDEIRFQFEILCHFLRDGMLLIPSEHYDLLALKLILNVKMTDEEKNEVFDKEGRIHNNEVARRFLLFKSRLFVLSDEKKAAQAQLELICLQERYEYLDSELRKMGSSIDKLRKKNAEVCNHILCKVLYFHERRLNAIGRYPIYLDFKGFIHIGLRHIEEWQFGDYYNDKTKFQLKEADVITTLEHVVDDINYDYQAIKQERPDFLYRKYGKSSIYLNGDYYMIHIAADGRVENFSKVVDKIKDKE